MDKQKVNEAIWEYQRNNHYENNPYRADIMDAFGNGAKWLMLQPLSDRLTEEEKKTIIFAYKASVKLIQETEITNPNASEVFRGQKQLLISIFGKDLFNDNPELLK